MEEILWFSEEGTVTDTDSTPKHLDCDELGIPEETKKVKARKEEAFCTTSGRGRMGHRAHEL